MEKYTSLNSILYSPLSVIFYIRTCPFSKSFTKQNEPRNSTKRLLSAVSLEELNKFFVMERTSKISFKAICVYACGTLEPLNVSYKLLIWVIENPSPLLMINLSLPLKFFFDIQKFSYYWLSDKWNPIQIPAFISSSR